MLHDPRVGFHQALGVPHERPDLPYAIGSIVVQVVPLTLLIVLHPRYREKLRELSGNTQCAHRPSHTAVRNRESLVQVEVTEVESCVPCPSDTEHPVCVCLVVITESARLVRCFDKLVYPRIVYPGILGVSYEDCSGPLRECRLERFKVHVPILVWHERHDLESGCGRPSRVARM